MSKVDKGPVNQKGCLSMETRKVTEGANNRGAVLSQVIVAICAAALNAGGWSVYAQDGNSSMVPDDIAQSTGVTWSTVAREPSIFNEIVGRLSRPYPDESGVDNRAVGAGRVIDGSEAEGIAVDFVRKHSALFTSEEFQLDTKDMAATAKGIANIREHANRGTDFTVVIAQSYKGIPVFDGELLVSVTQRGEIWQVVNRLSVLDDPPTIPLLSSDDALKAALALLSDPKATPDRAPRLMVFGPKQLVWRMNFGVGYGWEVLIDATTGAKVLMRKSERTACTINLTIKDADSIGMDSVEGHYYADASKAWAKYTDPVGFVTDSASPTGSSCFCVGYVKGDSIVTVDYDYNTSHNAIPYTVTSGFTTNAGGTYSKTITQSASTPMNVYEASVLYRECMRGWHFASDNYSYGRSLVVGYVDYSGPACGGDYIKFPNGRAILDNGPPSSGASIDDTILHEYGHAIQYDAYGGSWGRPNGCSCRAYASKWE